MAIAYNEEVQLKISAETISTSGVAALATQIEAIAKQAGEAGPRFTQLAGELRKLDQQQVSINGLTAAIESAKAARAAFTAAREQVATLDKALADAKGAGANRQATALLEAELRKANAALAASEAGWNKQRAALAGSRAAAQAAGVDTKNLGTAQQQLVNSLEATRNALAAQVASVNAARAAAAARANELRAQAAEEDRLNAIIAASKKKLEQAAQQQLAAEKRALDEAAAARARYAAETAAINARIAASTQNAFGSIGIRSAQQINAEISRIQASLGTLARSAGTSGADFDRAFAAAQARIKALQAELNGTVNAAGRLPAAIKPIAAAVAGMFAAGQIKSYTGDLIRIADEYKNLNARIGLTNTSVAGFNVSLDDMAALATRTSSALGSTVQLFTSLARAGAEMGSTQAEILRLTETINKSNQVAGQSAVAASAAIIQLIQGLQSGVLRGQEFNSIMEQSPRLARAMADGLDTTIGGLRKMANEGKLTSDVVMEALQSQAEVIDKEYAALPTTVGNALTNLSTQWTKFVGELDSGAGATSMLVDGISALAANLSEVAETTAFVGATAVTAFAIKGLGALQVYIAGLGAATGATGALATATAGVAAAMARLGPYLRAAGYVAIAYEVYKLVDAYKNLEVEQRKQAGLQADVDASHAKVAARLAEISRSTGVLVTSMAELDAAVAAGAIHFDKASTSWKAGADASVSAITRLGQVTFDLIEQFDKASTKKEALEGLAKAFDASSVVNVQNFARALDELQATGRISADEFKAAWASALDTLDGGQLVKFAQGWEVLSQVGQGAAEGLSGALAGVADRLDKLSGAQLAEFQQTLAGLFDAGKISAQEFAAFNDQVLAASFARLGVNAAQAMGTISEGAADAIATFTGIETALQKTSASAEQVQTALEAAFGQAILKADSLQAIEQLETRLQELATSGKLGADGIARITEEIDKQRGKIEDQIPGIQSLAEAYRNLGVKTQDELKRAAEVARQSFEFIQKSGTAAAADIEASFKAYAEAAIEANGGVADATLKAKAATVGMKIETEEAGKVIVRSMKEAREATAEIATAAQSATAGMSSLGKAAAGAATEGRSLAETWDEAGNMISEGMDRSVSAGRDAGALVGRYSEQQIQAIKTIDFALQEHTRNIMRNHNERIIAAGAEARALDRLADQQNRLSSSAARGVDDLKLRLIELNGTEDEIAKARLDRDKADVDRQIRLIELEIKRAAVRGESGEAARLREEIKLLQEQLVLIDKVYKTEQRNAKNTGEGSAGGGSGGSVGGASGGSSNTNTKPSGPSKEPPVRTVTVNLNLGGKTIPIATTEADADRLIRDLEALERVSP